MKKNLTTTALVVCLASTLNTVAAEKALVQVQQKAVTAAPAPSPLVAVAALKAASPKNAAPAAQLAAPAQQSWLNWITYGWLGESAPATTPATTLAATTAQAVPTATTVLAAPSVDSKIAELAAPVATQGTQEDLPALADAAATQQ